MEDVFGKKETHCTIVHGSVHNKSSVIRIIWKTTNAALISAHGTWDRSDEKGEG